MHFLCPPCRWNMSVTLWLCLVAGCARRRTAPNQQLRFCVRRARRRHQLFASALFHVRLDDLSQWLRSDCFARDLFALILRCVGIRAGAGLLAFFTLWAWRDSTQWWRRPPVQGPKTRTSTTTFFCDDAGWLPTCASLIYPCCACSLAFWLTCLLAYLQQCLFSESTGCRQVVLHPRIQCAPHQPTRGQLGTVMHLQS